MSSRVWMSVVVLTAVLAAGCGGNGGTTPGASLADQYQRAVKTTDPVERAKQLVVVAERQRQAGDLGGAQLSMKSAMDAAIEVQDPAGRATALNAVADAHAKAGSVSDAKATLKDVRKAADEIADNAARIKAVAVMAQIYARLPDGKAAATGYLKMVEDLAGAIADPESRVSAVLEMAAAYNEAQAAADAQKWIDSALETARGIPDARKRTDAITSIGAKLAVMKKSAEAQTVFQEAEKSVAAIETPLSQGYALVNLADKQRQAGQLGAASKLLNAAEAQADKSDGSLKEPLVNEINSQRGKL